VSEGCQVCGLRLETPTGAYAEGAHIRPVGRSHHGPDVPANVLCLCPNDHVRLDRGILVLTDDFDVVDPVSGARTGFIAVKPQHKLDGAHAAYHRSIHEVT
jgi:predicted restriction endonuclease